MAHETQVQIHLERSLPETREDTNAGVKTGQSTILTVTLLTGANRACWHVRQSAWGGHCVRP